MHSSENNIAITTKHTPSRFFLADISAIRDCLVAISFFRSEIIRFFSATVFSRRMISWRSRSISLCSDSIFRLSLDSSEGKTILGSSTKKVLSTVPVAALSDTESFMRLINRLSTYEDPPHPLAECEIIAIISEQTAFPDRSIYQFR